VKQVECFPLGSYFKIEGNADDTVWRVTDVGTRVVIAIEYRPGWMSGPPYAVVEIVFDENDQVVMVPCAEPSR
jgi:hypothetical protein